MNIFQLLDLVINRSASDLHLVVGYPPQLRINGELLAIEGLNPLTNEDAQNLIVPLLSETQKQVLDKEWEADLGFDFEGKGRFRINIYHERGHVAAALRLIPIKIRSLEETGLPPQVSRVTTLKQGLILVTGPTGHGKSTTLASMINQINHSRASNIITIEDPIEFIYPKAKSLISQREVSGDTRTWGNALRSALREDPDVVLVGEMRDLETISTTLTIAETGHLVFATLHTNSASQTIDRIVDVFPEDQQQQIKIQLAGVIEAIISQRLIPTISPGRALAYELLFSVPALKSLIREGKSHLIDNLIQTSAETGMVSLEMSLALLVREGKITQEVAQNYSLRPQVLSKVLGISPTPNRET